jgi:DNA adenine methylase
MSEAAHVELLEQLREVKGMVVLAGYPSPLYDRTLRDWRRVERSHYAAGSDRPRTEVLWISPESKPKKLQKSLGSIAGQRDSVVVVNTPPKGTTP